MRSHSILIGLTLSVIATATEQIFADDPVVKLGSGSYTTALPKGAKAPPQTIYRTENATGKMSTNKWWSSLAWMKFSERQFPHPLAVEAGPGGLRIFYPGPAIHANEKGIFGNMPGKSAADFVLGHSAQAEFPDALVDGFSEWFVSARFTSGKSSLKVSYGHGSPFVYALYEGGDPRLTFAETPQVWSGDARSSVLGVTTSGKHYALFGSGGSTWAGFGGKTLTNTSKGKNYFSAALLPDNSEKTLALFKRYAYSHVTDSQVEWSYDPKSSTVTTTFTFSTTGHEGKQDGTLFALYPHQWRTAIDVQFLGEYQSVRGKMKLAEGTAFRTVMRYPGVLPALPIVAGVDKQTFASALQAEVDRAPAPLSDTYADGKWLGRNATLIPIAEQFQLDDAAKALRERVRHRLEEWLTAADEKGRPQDRGLFYYDDRWGTLIGYPASYGSDDELNDHHFHYGYFIKAAAEIARRDPAWAKDDRWGRMVRLLIRDTADWDHKDTMFPFLRNFDVYAGHSWASGHARFGDGNNNESSSEAMNTWSGLILWGEATGDRAIRDLGIYLYTTEMHGIVEYWFDVHGENHAKGYTPSVVTMVWGGQGVNATWFSARPEHIHGINWMPFHGGSLYLGQFPAYVEKNYAALIKENSGTSWKEWSDLIWMYRALDDPQDAVKLFEAAKDKITYEAGNSKANTYAWIYGLSALGQIDASVSADIPQYAVFRKGRIRTYCVYNNEDGPRTILFSDGLQLKASAAAFATVIAKE